MRINHLDIPVHAYETVVVGSGAAGYNAADWLWTLGRGSVAIVTEGRLMGTSRNTGSDKQTYYKLSLAGGEGDSVEEMAKTLYAGGGVNGDSAYIEAACSVKCFMKLASLGVPFPTNEYGEYVGYKTDHDPRSRATSAGPLTSKYMTEALERAVADKGVDLYDGLQAVRLIVHEGRVRGLICIDDKGTLTVFEAQNVILATGGPAGVYEASVYPESQTGSTGMALEAGAAAVNLDQWQYGLASTKFRWNVSGSYQQVLPRYISLDKNGREREFLPEALGSAERALNLVFLKGYQWPFDAAKVEGSSVVDLLVHRETAERGNRVFLDFRRNPAGLEEGYGLLSDEARAYLEKSGSLGPTPFDRLKAMNPRACQLYKDNGIDLETEPLEIAVCAQHNNGGLLVDANWMTTVTNLYAAGEAAGTFGVYRPGGAALNSTQVGSMRAAEHIASRPPEAPRPFKEQELVHEIAPVLKRIEDATGYKYKCNVMRARRETQRAMTRSAAHLRDPEAMRELERVFSEQLALFGVQLRVGHPYDLVHLMKSRDLLVTQLALLSAMTKAADRSGSRGSALVASGQGRPLAPLGRDFRYRPAADDLDGMLLVTRLDSDTGRFVSEYEPARPFPAPDGWFESVWREYEKRTANLKRTGE